LALTNWSYGLACLADLLRLRRHADLIFTRDPRLAWIFIKTRVLHGRPVVYEVHELFSTRPRDNRSLDPAEIRGVAGRTRNLERTVFAEADLLIPLTRSCADLLREEHGVAGSRLAVVPDGTAAPTGDIPARVSHSRTVVYAGQLYPWKGVDTLIGAMKGVPGARLTILGGLGPDDPNLAACRALARQGGIAERVHFAGFVPHADVRSRLAVAGVGVVPLPDRLMSRYFTSPLKLFDYMAAGVPIVASDLRALREVLLDGENALLVPPGDAEAMARAINRLLDDASLAERLRRRAFVDVADYTWERRADRIIEAAEPLARS
jgi:glycosyltransferase involved in cell wall biosynthesis